MPGEWMQLLHMILGSWEIFQIELCAEWRLGSSDPPSHDNASIMRVVSIAAIYSPAGRRIGLYNPPSKSMHLS